MADADEIRSLDDLVLDDANANRGTERGAEAIDASLANYGGGRSVLVDRKGRLIAGNKTMPRAKALGMGAKVVHTSGEDLVVVVRDDLDLDDPHGKARQLALADNRAGQLDLEFDKGILREQLAGLQEMQGPFWSAEEMEELQVHMGEEDEPDHEGEDEVPPVPENPITRFGEMIRLGRHLLRCGDSGEAEEMDALMGNALADMVWTDPPYGLDIAGGAHDPRDKRNYHHGDRLENDDVTEQELMTLLRYSFARAYDRSKNGAVWYVSAPAGPLFFVYATVLRDLGVWRQTLNWIKDNFVFGRSDYHYRHEPMFYGWKPGAAHHAVADRTQDSCWDLGNAVKDLAHPTMKPVALVRRALENSSDRGQLVLDPFVGSGTTIIAAEQTGRTAYGMEIDPAYCDVIVERWQQYTGEKAERLP